MRVRYQCQNGACTPSVIRTNYRFEHCTPYSHDSLHYRSSIADIRMSRVSKLSAIIVDALVCKVVPKFNVKPAKLMRLCRQMLYQIHGIILVCKSHNISKSSSFFFWQYENAAPPSTLLSSQHSILLTIKTSNFIPSRYNMVTITFSKPTQPTNYTLTVPTES